MGVTGVGESRKIRGAAAAIAEEPGRDAEGLAGVWGGFGHGGSSTTRIQVPGPGVKGAENFCKIFLLDRDKGCGYATSVRCVKGEQNTKGRWPPRAKRGPIVFTMDVKRFLLNLR